MEATTGLQTDNATSYLMKTAAKKLVGARMCLQVGDGIGKAAVKRV